MNLSIPNGLEAGIAVLFALWIVCAKPECGLFLYGLALGFPDAALPLGTVINLRMDDCVIVFFLLRCFLWVAAPLGSNQKSIFKWQVFLLAACSLSAVVGIVRGTPPGEYELLKMIGCAAIIFVLPRLLQSERRLRYLIAGLMCAGIAMVVQIVLRLAGSSASAFVNFQELKSAATFTTWNPNTIGQAAMLLVFAAGLGWLVFPRSRFNSCIWFCLATGFTLIPVLVFARGTSLSIGVGFVLFLCLARRWKTAILFLFLCVSAVGYLRLLDRDLVDGATSVDIATGEGFSHRFDRWDMAIEAIKSEPVLGHGFGQEWTLLANLGSEGRAHNAYMSVWIEVGLGGLMLLLAMVYQFVRVGLSFYGQHRFQLCGALLLALVVAVSLDSIALPTLYWEKLPAISLSIGLALIGICERNRPETVLRTSYPVQVEAVAQHS